MKHINALNTVLGITFLFVGYMTGSLHSDIKHYYEAVAESERKLAASHGWEITEPKIIGPAAYVDKKLALAKLTDGRKAALVIKQIDAACVVVGVDSCTSDDNDKYVIRYGETYQVPDPYQTKDFGWLMINVKRGEVYPEITMYRLGSTKL